VAHRPQPTGPGAPAAQGGIEHLEGHPPTEAEICVRYTVALAPRPSSRSTRY
jgi:hypothetical protein